MASVLLQPMAMEELGPPPKKCKLVEAVGKEEPLENIQFQETDQYVIAGLSLYDMHCEPLRPGSLAPGKNVDGSNTFDDKVVVLNIRELNEFTRCAICLQVIEDTWTVMQCLHRFCANCIQSYLRLGQKECPTCRAKMNSRRDMRMDHHFDYLLRKLYPDRKAYQVHEEAIIANINRDIGRTNAKRFEEMKKRQMRQYKLALKEAKQKRLSEKMDRFRMKSSSFVSKDREVIQFQLLYLGSSCKKPNIGKPFIRCFRKAKVLDIRKLLAHLLFASQDQYHGITLYPCYLLCLNVSPTAQASTSLTSESVSAASEGNESVDVDTGKNAPDAMPSDRCSQHSSDGADSSPASAPLSPTSKALASLSSEAVYMGVEEHSLDPYDDDITLEEIHYKHWRLPDYTLRVGYNFIDGSR